MGITSKKQKHGSKFSHKPRNQNYAFHERLKNINETNKNIRSIFFHVMSSNKKNLNLASIYLFKVNNGNTITMSEIYSNLTVDTRTTTLMSLWYFNRLT